MHSMDKPFCKEVVIEATKKWSQIVLSTWMDWDKRSSSNWFSINKEGNSPHLDFAYLSFLRGKEGKNPCKYCIHCSWHTLSASLGGKTPIYLPTGLHQSQNLAYVLPKLTNIAQLSFLKVKTGSAPLKIAQVTPSSLILPVSLLGWYVTHLSPHGPQSEPKSAKNLVKVTRFCVVVFFIGTEGNSPLKNCIHHILWICPTLSASWGGTSPISIR